MSKLTMKQLAIDVTLLEKGKQQVSIAQVSEILGVLSDIMVSGGENEVTKLLVANGNRRLAKANRALKAGSKKKVAKKVAKKVTKKSSKKKVIKKVSKKKVTRKRVRKIVTKPVTAPAMVQ